MASLLLLRVTQLQSRQQHKLRDDAIEGGKRHFQTSAECQRSQARALDQRAKEVVDAQQAVRICRALRFGRMLVNGQTCEVM